MHGCNILDCMIVVSGFKMGVAIDGCSILHIILSLFLLSDVLHDSFHVPRANVLTLSGGNWALELVEFQLLLC